MKTESKPYPFANIRIVVYLFVSLIAVILVLESATRYLNLAPLQRHASIYTTDPFLPYRPKPSLRSEIKTEEFAHEIRHNSLGFRDSEHAVEKPVGTFRIVALGDSFTYGVGATYENTYLAILERELRQRVGPRIEVIKLGIPGYFPETERMVLQHYGLQYRPDLVIAAFLPNDVIDTYLGVDDISVTPDGYLKTRDAKRLGAAGMWLYMNSAVARVLWNKLNPTAVTVRKMMKQREYLKDNGLNEPEWRMVEQEYKRMASLSADIGAKFMLMAIPGGDLGDVATTYPGRRLGKLARDNGFMFLDLHPIFAANNRSNLFWLKDGHCTPQGYALIGQSLAVAVQNAGIQSR